MSTSSRFEHGRRVTEHFERSIAEMERRHGTVPRDEMMAMFQIMATHDLLARLMSATVESQGLSFAGFRVLAMIAKEAGGRVPMRRLSEWLSVSRQNVTGLVDGLEKRGLVGRSTCGADRRVKWVELTEEGRTVLQALAPRHFAVVRALFGNLPPVELETLSSALTAIRDRVLTLGPELEPTFNIEPLMSDCPACPPESE
jgi:DNA-binding MarR family transcriptional regulator